MDKVEHIYIHIPFCDSKCPYCDFYSIPKADDHLKGKYINKILEEIELYSDILTTDVKSLYIGGGTPNSLSVNDLDKLLSGFLKKVNVSNDLEFTIEVNPGSVTEDKLNLFKNFGINRISIGSQSFLINELRTLGRTHTPKEIYKTYETARKLGFKNINLDLIFSIPGQTINSLIYSINKLIELDPEHISAYMLTYYKGTEFHTRLINKNLFKQEDDIESEYYDIVKEILGSVSYEHYELSNFSKNSKRSKHNLNTWNFGNYLGLGAAAHSFFNNIRWYNNSDVRQYCDNELPKHPNKIIIALQDKKNEFVMLGLRKIEGLSLSYYYKIFGMSIENDFGNKIKKYIENNFLILENKTLRINHERINIYNSIVSDILLD